MWAGSLPAFQPTSKEGCGNGLQPHRTQCESKSGLFFSLAVLKMPNDSRTMPDSQGIKYGMKPNKRERCR